VSLGALDMVNFGPRETVPAEFEERNLYVHNAQVTLMRTTPAESASLGEEIARKLSASTGPVALFVPLGGISMIATPGGPFYDAAADEALFAAVREHAGSNVELVELETDINDPAFADAMVAKLHGYVGGAA
ncbi:MAG TPA: Tm-1-like ATP-binding domain-containing protein, partial [Gaiellales bacterium]|nr:Tm-1-like ATP-binding domain-containing protein [Gaiellales bacterium]